MRAALEEDRELVHQAALLDPNASASLDLDDDPHGLRRAAGRARRRARARPARLMDLLVVGDANADLVLRGGDIVPGVRSA